MKQALSHVPQSSPRARGPPSSWPVSADAQGPSTQTGPEKAGRPRETGPAATELSDPSALQVINGPDGAAMSAPGQRDLLQGGGLSARLHHPASWPSLPGEPPVVLGLVSSESRLAEMEMARAGHRQMSQCWTAGHPRGLPVPAAGLVVTHPGGSPQVCPTPAATARRPRNS